MKPALFRRFFKNTSGNVAPIFAIAAIPLITATGAAVDYSSAYRERWQVQDALDADECSVSLVAVEYVVFDAQLAQRASPLFPDALPTVDWVPEV